MTILFDSKAFRKVMEPLERGLFQAWLEVPYEPSTSLDTRYMAFKAMEQALSRYDYIEIVHIRWLNQFDVRMQKSPYIRYSLDVLFWYRKESS